MELSRLEQGWLDGELGEPVTDAAQRSAAVVIRSMERTGVATASVFPTEGGGVMFYWGGSPSMLTVEALPDGGLHLHALNSDGSARDETVSTYADLTAALDRWLSTGDHSAGVLALSPQAAGERMASALRNALRVHRVKRRTSLRDIAAHPQCSWTNATVSEIERGARHIKVSELPVIAAVYDIPITELLDTILTASGAET